MLPKTNICSVFDGWMQTCALTWQRRKTTTGREETVSVMQLCECERVSLCLCILNLLSLRGVLAGVGFPVQGKRLFLCGLRVCTCVASRLLCEYYTCRSFS